MKTLARPISQSRAASMTAAPTSAAVSPHTRGATRKTVAPPVSAPRVRAGLPQIAFGVLVGVLVSAWAAAFTGDSPKPVVVAVAKVVAAAEARDTLGIQWLPESVAAWAPQILEAARAHGVAPELVAIVMLVESGGHPGAVSPSGAVGLMQVMPATGEDIAAQRGLAFTTDQLNQPELNVDFGAWYLADQLARFGQSPDEDWQASVSLAAAAYNGGPGKLQASVQDGTALPAETSAYKSWVSGMWRERRDDKSPTFEGWLAAGGWRLVDAASATIAMAQTGGSARP